MKLSVTIATYNRVHLLKKSLEALAKQTLDLSKFEVIVCDSNSNDGTETLVRKFISRYQDLNIKHIHTINNLAAKRNTGIKNATGDVVIFFDDDCIPELDCLAKYFSIIETNQNNNRVVYCGEVRFPADWVKKSNFYRFRNSRHFGSGNRLDLKKLDYTTIVVMNMAFYKDEFIRTVKTVNENFKGYGCEDQDLGWRLQSYGFDIIQCDARIYHYEESGNIAGYEKKIFHTARDGMETLLSENIEAVKPLNSFKLLDKDFPFESKLTSYAYNLVRVAVFHQLLSKLLVMFVTKTDKVKFLYFPKFYRYILGCAYIRGVDTRKNKPRGTDDWYS